jgi:pimeloyl-ACP methyl ester carboxylesterase
LLGVVHWQIFAREDRKMIFQYDNSSIYYKVFGNGPALVLLHGFLESSSIWKNLVEPLSEKYTVIIIDLPGHGKSETIAEVHTMELMAKAIHELLLSLKISDAILAGHSMGGYVALAYTELFEEKVSKLILLNSTTDVDTEERKLNRNRAVEIINQEKKSFLNMAIANLFSPTSRLRFAKEIEGLKKEAYGFPPKGIIANIKGMRDRKDRINVLKKFPRTKWIICGNEDPVIPLSSSKSISKETNSKLKILSGSHMSWLENEEEIVNFMLLID